MLVKANFTLSVRNRNGQPIRGLNAVVQIKGTVTDAKGTVIARTHAIGNYGDSVAAQTNIRSAMYGETLTAIEEGSTVRLSVRTGTPVFDGEGKVVGMGIVWIRKSLSIP